MVRGRTWRTYQTVRYGSRAGNRESGIGNRESGIGNRESGVGSRESGVGSRDERRATSDEPSAGRAIRLLLPDWLMQLRPNPSDQYVCRFKGAVALHIRKSRSQRNAQWRQSHGHAVEWTIKANA
ncbi:hypothetical protein EIQ29_11280 [Xanthomonas campestris]